MARGAGAEAPAPAPAPDPAFPALSLGPAPARRRPCKAPVGPLALNAFTVSRSGLVVSSRSLAAVPTDGGQGPPGPAPPGGSRSAAPRQHPGARRPLGLAARPAGPGLEPPLAPARGSCRPPIRSGAGVVPMSPQSSGQCPAVSRPTDVGGANPLATNNFSSTFFDEFFPLRRAWHFRRSLA